MKSTALWRRGAEIAARAHAERLAPMVEAVLADAGMALGDVDAIAATAGPGLIGGVMVGLVTGKALAMPRQALAGGEPSGGACAFAAPCR
jgi:tRNA A37 threonylcarbamoyladenosine modification protein TsaB